MKTKKTGKTMRVAGLLLALVLVTSCFVGGTFAKYVTSGTGTNSARVAKFGATVTGNGTLFAEEYKGTGEAVTVKSGGSVLVGDTEYKKVVAPGAEGNLASATLTGTPEVAVKVDYTAKVSLGGKWEDAAGNFYCPLTIKINKTAIEGATFTSKESMENAVAEAINEYSKTYDPNTNLEQKVADVLSVSWTWAFEHGASADEISANNVKDTYLGDQAAAGTPGTISVDLTTTVTQID